MLRRSLLATALAALATTVALPAATALAQSETLTVWATDQLADPLVAEPWNKLKADFEAANPGVTVEYMPPTGTISNGAVQAAIQSDAGPDVLLTNSGIGRVTTVVNAKLVQPLTAHYADMGWKDKIFPWLYDILAGQFGGEIYEVPDGIDVIGIWYHKDLFAENGWTIGGTWADFVETLKKIKAKGLEPIAVGPRNNANGGHLMGNFLQAAAGRAAMGDVVGGNKPWTDAEPLLGAQRIVELAQQGLLSPQMTGLDLEAAARIWTNKRAAIFFGGPWFIGNARSNEYDLANMGFATIPSDIAGESLPTGGIGWSWMVPTSSKHPDLAIKWIDFILSDDVMRLCAEHPTGTQISPREIGDFKPAVPVMAEIAAAAAAGVGYNPSVYMPGAALDTYFQVIQGLVGGQVTAEAGMQQIQSMMPAK
jgi:raffinose/stachyose/melibiose transport system substrate-binding protein